MQNHSFSRSSYSISARLFSQIDALQEVTSHDPGFLLQRYGGFDFPGDRLCFGFPEEMEETGSSLNRSGHVGFNLHLLGFVGYGCGDAAHGDAGDSGVGVAVQVGIAELLVLFFGVFLYGGVGGKFIFDGAECFSGGCGCEYLVQGLFCAVGDGFAGGIVEF